MTIPLVVNLYGGPGCGKSSGAAYIFSQLKMKGINCELITEFAKDLTWEERKLALSCQEYVFGQQSLRMRRCWDKVDVIITDSPLLLSWIYTNNSYLDESFKKVILNTYNCYENMNYFINRVKPYNPQGRNESEDRAKELDIEIMNFLEDEEIDYTFRTGDIDGYDLIVKEVTLQHAFKFNEYKHLSI